jgi:hypothetical protein
MHLSHGWRVDCALFVHLVRSYIAPIEANESTKNWLLGFENPRKGEPS